MEHTASSRQRAGIVGGGIGGLAAAIALRKAGWDVTVYEQASEFAEVGAGLVLLPNALAALDEIGVGDDIRANSHPYSLGGIRNPRGRILMSHRKGAGGRDPVIVHRADLIDVLVRALPAGCLRTGTAVNSVGVDGEVVTAAGADRYDLVVAADGVHSVVRQQIWPGEGSVEGSGVTAWRWIIDAPPPSWVGQVWGNREEFGILPLTGGRTWAYAGARGGVDILEHFADWPEPVSQLVANADPTRIIEHELLEIRPPKSLIRGKIALIGDAAHAMHPHLGLGAATAIEDAVTLAAFATDLPGYNKDRRRRVRTSQWLSRRMSRVIMPANRPFAAVRDVVMGLTPGVLALSVFGVVNRWRPRPITCRTECDERVELQEEIPTIDKRIANEK
ncbi:FAD-dependent monooxygenase [Aldersonia sp. NBC_00410]|uniref:FAD-dependent monooxygenase n=1 Tax=Aldersonia sp. NBC_00410 TaxID=2975954 RepID=UPI0022525A24|nr:FAD-dependent monooxygenase [Aldersonia sp. NBC_00410]MCX5044804.1 FAD-dependent monooxygenase [Aldersonia sp. NBC_00410]